MGPLGRFAKGVARAWANQPLTSKGLVVVALPLGVLMLALTSLYFASADEARAEEDVRLAFAIQRDTHEVHALLAEAANGVRGYLLTGQNRFLEPYFQAERELPGTLARLDGTIRDAAVRARFERVMALTGQKRAGLERLRTLAGQQAMPVAERDETISALVANKVVLDGLREEIREIQRLEGALLQARLDRVDAARARNLALTAVSGVIGLLGSLAAVYLFSTGIVRRVQRLEDNASRLEQGAELVPLHGDRDEIGRLASRLEDASALLRAREHALRESEERFRLVIEGVRDYGIFALGPDGLVASWNAGAERIKGWTSDEVIGRHFEMFYPAETRDERPPYILGRADSEGRAEDEGWRVRKDGSKFWANVVVTALRNEAGELRGFAKITRDMTERKRAEEALRSAREEALAASAAKTQFLSRTSHELRTPMSAILGFAQVLELDRETLRAPQRTAVDQILKAGRHLLSLINEILDISSIEAGGVDMTLSEADITAALREARDLATPIAQAAGLMLEYADPGHPLFVRCDPRRVTQIALNLLSNAIKYGGDGGVVRLACMPHGANVRVEVLDHGVGIEEGDVHRLFSPFDRLGRERTGDAEGTGLGLALSKSLVESMGGAIGFHNRPPPERGALFWFELPYQRSSDGVARSRADGAVESHV